MVAGYQGDNFTHTWLAENFVAQSHINSSLTGKLSILTHFPLETGCEDYFFLDQSVKDFEHGPYSLLTDSVETELDASFDEADAMHTLWCKARALLLPIPQTGKMSFS